MFKFNFFILIIHLIFQGSLSLDNGEAENPPMGWLTWSKYACNIDCDTYPNDCISENLIYRQAHVLAKEYLEYGYKYIIIDDCWSEMERDNVTNELVADRKRFPGGIKKLADYVHSKGLKMGIYSDIGTKTCAGYPGHEDSKDKSKFYFDIDAQTFARWGIDFLKVDGCNGETNDFDKTYPALGESLNETKRQIVFSCSWPAYLIEDKNLDFNKIAKACNVWRNYDDINFSWTSVLSIMDFFAKHQDEYSQIHGPGKWFDPDMIIVGNNGLSFEQMKAQMAIWSIWSAPLFMSNDLYKISNEEKKLLTNRHLIAVNQDEEGIMGRRVIKDRDFEVWLKPLSPVSLDGVEHWQYAIVYLNKATLGSAKYFSKTIKDMIAGYGKGTRSFNPLKELKNHQDKQISYIVLDLFDDAVEIDRVKIDSNLKLLVDVGGAVRMVQLVPLLDP